MNTSRHQVRARLALLLALGMLAAAGCSDGKGPTDAHGNEPPPDPTPKGTPTGPIVTATIGRQGGSLTSADGGLTLTVPAGAVTAATEFGIQPITTTLPGGLGQAYRLTPTDQTFGVPVTLSMRYTNDELNGQSPEELGIAAQDPDGVWWGVLTTAVDSARQSLTISTAGFAFESPTLALARKAGAMVAGSSTHLSATIPPFDVVKKPFDSLVVDRSTIKVKESAKLKFWNCLGTFAVDRYLKGRVPAVLISFQCTEPTRGSGVWSVNGVPNGTPSIGIVLASGAEGSYASPAKISSASMTATVRVDWTWTLTDRQGTTLPAKARGVARIRVEGDCIGGLQRASFSRALAIASDDVCRVEWTGTSSSTITANGQPAFRIKANVTWKVDPALTTGSRVTYYPVGSVTFTSVDPCVAIDPSTLLVGKENGGQLVVDFGQTPATYEGVGVTVWPASYRNTCEGVAGGTAAAGGGWFTGRGTVSADLLDIADTQTAGGQTFTYAFTRRDTSSTPNPAGALVRH